jgi:hypothetical protein
MELKPTGLSGPLLKEFLKELCSLLLKENID